MSILSWIATGGKTAEKAMDAIISTGDALVFTDEEQSAANLTILNATIEYQKATQGQNVARRLIALTVTALAVLLIAMIVAVRPISPEYAEFIKSVLVEFVKEPFMIIIAFYFLSRMTKVGK